MKPIHSDEIYVRKYFIVLLIVLQTIISMMFVMHMDIEIIVNWLKEFWECFVQHDFAHYQERLTVLTYPVNYNVLAVILLSICMSPLYIADNLFHLHLTMDFWGLCFKFLILFFNLITEFFVYKTAGNIYQNKKIQQYALVLYMVSPFVLFGSLANGQIDCLGNLFVVLTLYSMSKEKYTHMCLWMSFAILFKGLAALVLAPIFIIKFSKSYIESVKYGALVVSIPLLSKVITYIFFPGYQDMVDYLNKSIYNFGSRLFTFSLNQLSVVIFLIVIILFMCVKKSDENKAGLLDYVLFPMITFFTFLMLVFWHPQWMIYISIFITIAFLYINSRYVYWLNFILSASYITYTSIQWTAYGSEGCFDNMMMKHSLIGKLIMKITNKEWVEIHMMDYFPEHTVQISISVMMACIFLIIYLLYSKKKEIINADDPASGLEEPDNNIIKNEIFAALQLVPMIAFMIVSVFLFVTNLA